MPAAAAKADRKLPELSVNNTETIQALLVLLPAQSYSIQYGASGYCICQAAAARTDGDYNFPFIIT